MPIAVLLCRRYVRTDDKAPPPPWTDVGYALHERDETDGHDAQLFRAEKHSRR